LTHIPHITGFEIRLHKADGTVSIIMSVCVFGVFDAEQQAAKMLNDDMAYAVVWQGDIEVGTAHRDKPN
jgi:hypothetical protein